MVIRYNDVLTIVTTLGDAEKIQVGNQNLRIAVVIVTYAERDCRH